MKYLMLLLLLLMLNCSIAYSDMADSYYQQQAAGHELYYGDFSEIQTLQDISVWIMNNVYYKADETDSWDNPEEVIKRGYGDCDDFAILVMNIAYVRFGIEFDLVLVDTEIMKSIEEGGNINHASVAINQAVFNV